jgi:hypothetical protein
MTLPHFGVTKKFCILYFIEQNISFRTQNFGIFPDMYISLVIKFSIQNIKSKHCSVVIKREHLDHKNPKGVITVVG